MLEKAFWWCKRHWKWGIPLLLAIPLLILRGAGLAVLPSWARESRSPIIDPETTKRKRKRIHAFAQSERERINRRADAVLKKVRELRK